MKLHILVEGPSEEAFLKEWLPRFLPRHPFIVITHQGKGRLSGDPKKEARRKAPWAARSTPSETSRISGKH